MGIFPTKSESFDWWAGSEHWVLAIPSARECYGEVGVAIDLCHFNGL